MTQLAVATRVKLAEDVVDLLVGHGHPQLSAEQREFVFADLSRAVFVDVSEEELEAFVVSLVGTVARLEFLVDVAEKYWRLPGRLARDAVPIILQTERGVKTRAARLPSVT